MFQLTDLTPLLFALLMQSVLCEPGMIFGWIGDLRNRVMTNPPPPKMPFLQLLIGKALLMGCAVCSVFWLSLIWYLESYGWTGFQDVAFFTMGNVLIAWTATKTLEHIGFI